MRIAIATYKDRKERYKDIDLVIRALERSNHTAEPVVWDAPNVRWEEYDTVFIDSTWDYTKKPEVFLDWCKKTSRVCELVNSWEIIQLSSNKRYLITLAGAGLHLPETSILELTTPLDANLFARYGSKVVIKPLVGAGGRDTFLFENIQAAISSPSLSDMLTKREVLVQEYVPEIETLGEIGAIFISGRLSHCVLKKPGHDDFRVQHRYGGATTLTTFPRSAEGLYRQVTSVLGINPTYMRLDFVPTDNPTIMEVEMVEPDKYFSLYPEGATLLAEALVGQSDSPSITY